MPVEVNCTLIVQVLPVVIVTEPFRQVLEPVSTVNCADPVPVMVGVPLKVRVRVPLLVMVTLFVEVPLVTVPKASEAGEMLTSVDVPVRGNIAEVCPFGSVEKLTVTFPATLPKVDVLGLKVTLKKQL